MESHVRDKRTYNADRGEEEVEDLTEGGEICSEFRNWPH